MFRLAGKKFGHTAGMKKINLEKVRRNKPKITKISIGKNKNREIAAQHTTCDRSCCTWRGTCGRLINAKISLHGLKKTKSIVIVGGVGIEGMMTLPKVEALVWNLRTG